MSSKGRTADRQPDDFYETPAWATDAILPYLNLTGSILEPGAGHGAIAERLLAAGVPRDRITLNELDGERARICSLRTGIDTTTSDFLAWPCVSRFDLVIGNPPYLLAQEFLERARQVVRPTGEVVMLLRLNFVSGLKRVAFWRENPAHIFVLPKRPSFCIVLRDGYQCARCKRKWKVPHGAGPFVIPVDDQCECGEIPTFKKTTKTGNDSCEYAWFSIGAHREQRWDLLELPEKATKEIEGGAHAGVRRTGNGFVQGRL